MSEYNCDVVIIGGGAAGLSCGKDLFTKGGLKVIILEAQDRLGGRTHTYTLGDGTCCDLGAAWVQAHHHTHPLSKLLKGLQIKVKQTNWMNMQLYDVTNSRYYSEKELNHGFAMAEKLLNRSKTLIGSLRKQAKLEQLKLQKDKTNHNARNVIDLDISLKQAIQQVIQADKKAIRKRRETQKKNKKTKRKNSETSSPGDIEKEQEVIVSPYESDLIAWCVYLSTQADYAAPLEQLSLLNYDNDEVFPGGDGGDYLPRTGSIHARGLLKFMYNSFIESSLSHIKAYHLITNFSL